MYGLYFVAISWPRDSPISLLDCIQGAIVTESIIKCGLPDYKFNEEFNDNIHNFIYLLFWA